MIETAKQRKERQKEKIAWYIKWFSSIVVMVAMAIRATGEPELAVYDLYLSTVGIFGWLIVSLLWNCLLYTSPSPRDGLLSRMPSSA